MHTPAVPNPTTGYPFGPDTTYGMGWHIGTIAGVPTLWHDGVSVAYHAFMLLEPQNHWGAVLLVNANTNVPNAANGNAFFYDLYAGLARRLSGLAPPPPGLSLSQRSGWPFVCGQRTRWAEPPDTARRGRRQRYSVKEEERQL